MWDNVVGTRGDQLVNEDGGLVGPFNAFVHAPEVGRHLSALGATVRFGTSIERRLSELAIITVGARWKAEFEASQLVETGRVGQDAYDAARESLGDAGMVELVSLCGYYTLISFVLNAFDVRLPPGVPEVWGSEG